MKTESNRIDSSRTNEELAHQRHAIILLNQEIDKIIKRLSFLERKHIRRQRAINAQEIDEARKLKRYCEINKINNRFVDDRLGFLDTNIEINILRATINLLQKRINSKVEAKMLDKLQSGEESGFVHLRAECSLLLSALLRKYPEIQDELEDSVIFKDIKPMTNPVIMYHLHLLSEIQFIHAFLKPAFNRSYVEYEALTKRYKQTNEDMLFVREQFKQNSDSFKNPLLISVKEQMKWEDQSIQLREKFTALAYKLSKESSKIAPFLELKKMLVFLEKIHRNMVDTFLVLSPEQRLLSREMIRNYQVYYNLAFSKLDEIGDIDNGRFKAPLDSLRRHLKLLSPGPLSIKYPSSLSLFGVPAKKATGPRVLNALNKMNVDSRYTHKDVMLAAEKFILWAKDNNRHFNSNSMREITNAFVL